jgi:hypothetical protein
MEWSCGRSPPSRSDCWVAATLDRPGRIDAVRTESTRIGPTQIDTACIETGRVLMVSWGWLHRDSVNSQRLTALSAGEGMYRESSGSPRSRKLATQTLPDTLLCWPRSAGTPSSPCQRGKLDRVAMGGLNASYGRCERAIESVNVTTRTKRTRTLACRLPHLMTR